jgi:ornithine cyclodeaminase
MVDYIGIERVRELVERVGTAQFIEGLAHEIEADFRRWREFDKSPRHATHSPVGVIELMPISDGTLYSFKYVNGHPKNTAQGLLTVTAFGVLADVATGYPLLLSELTFTTALRTAATSVLAARWMARPSSRSMALIGNGAQAEFQALAFKAMLGVTTLRLQDTDCSASLRCARNLSGQGFDIAICGTAEEAVEGVQIVTTATADKRNSTILTDNMASEGLHINAVGGDCPGKTELHRDILLRSDIFVEYAPQTRIEGEIQQLAADHPVTELWRVVSGLEPGRRDPRQITLFDNVGFAIEDFAALRYVRRQAMDCALYEELDLLADPDDPRDLYGMLLRAAAAPCTSPRPLLP